MSSNLGGSNLNGSDLNERGEWSSRFGFILAAAGSAIGLGNIWRFPYTAGEYGGGAFVLVYLIFVVLIGIPVQLAELSIGRATQKNPVGAFKKLAPKTWWPVVGGLGVVSGFGILSFYAVIAGWTVGYLWYAVTGKFGTELTSESSAQIFTALASDPLGTVGLTALFLAMTGFVVSRGIGGGIEKAARILMPMFFVLLILMAIRSLTLDGAGEGLAFLFHVDFSRMTEPAVLGSALGQALFSLSLGMGAMITYGSYLSKKEHLPIAGASVAFFDTLIAILAGLILFPALFHAGVEPSVGPSLIFVVMPTVFQTMPFGTIFGIAFYCLLAIAALTSTISLLEVIVSYFVDEKKWSRPKTAWTMSAICFAIAVPSALSQGASGFFGNFLDTGMDFLSWMDTLFGKYGLTLGALGICVFAGWKWTAVKAQAEIEASGTKMPAAALWRILVRYVCPLAILAVLGLIIAGIAEF